MQGAFLVSYLGSREALLDLAQAICQQEEDVSELFGGEPAELEYLSGGGLVPFGDRYLLQVWSHTTVNILGVNWWLEGPRKLVPALEVVLLWWEDGSEEGAYQVLCSAPGEGDTTGGELCPGWRDTDRPWSELEHTEASLDLDIDRIVRYGRREKGLDWVDFDAVYCWLWDQSGEEDVPDDVREPEGWGDGMKSELRTLCEAYCEYERTRERGSGYEYRFLSPVDGWLPSVACLEELTERAGSLIRLMPTEN